MNSNDLAEIDVSCQKNNLHLEVAKFILLNLIWFVRYVQYILQIWDNIFTKNSAVREENQRDFEIWPSNIYCIGYCVLNDLFFFLNIYIFTTSQFTLISMLWKMLSCVFAMILLKDLFFKNLGWRDLSFGSGITCASLNFRQFSRIVDEWSEKHMCVI